MNSVYEKLRGRFKFGAWKEGEGKYCGRWVCQSKDRCTITVHQNPEIRKVETIVCPRGRLSQKDDVCTADETSALRSGVYQVAYYTSQTRMDGAGDIAFLQTVFPEPHVRDIAEFNRIVRKLKNNPVELRFQHIPANLVRFLLTTDSAWGNASDGRSQAGWGIFATEACLDQGLQAKVNPLAWKSHRLKAATPSTLSSETKALNEGLSELEWVQALWTEGRNPKVVLKDLIVEGSGLRGIIALDVSTSGEIKTYCGSGVATVDCKSVYDVLTKAGTSSDKRVAIELQVIKDALSRNNHLIRWVDTRWMLVDSLTKAGHNSEYLRSVLKSGLYRLVDEQEGLDQKRSDGLSKTKKKVLRV